MRRLCVSAVVLTTVSSLALFLGASQAAAAPVEPVHPGMEVRQGTTLCTLGYVDVTSRTAYTAGHCRNAGPVTDREGNVIGHQTSFRDNTPDGTTVSTDHLISDWQAIALLPEIMVGNVLPNGKVLFYDPAVVPAPGQQVCHFGVVTGESCGTVEAVNNGWFTMANGVVSQKGDSGGPVYALTADGRAVIVGMFNSTWGQFPAAVSWSATDQQIRDELVVAPAPA